MSDKNNQAQILEGSRAIALTIKNIGVEIVSAYPITPQTHIVEDLARFKADGEADYEYLRAESEFAAASIVLGASAAGARVYTSTSSQGLLLMTEVLFNIAGMRLPIVLTCANRAIGAPINIWNDQQDIMTVRDAGFLMFFAENHQEAVWEHILAYKLAEKLRLPAFVNVDGFILTHSYEEVLVPTEEEIKKFLPPYAPKSDQYLNTENPKTFGPLVTPAHYQAMRQELHDDLSASETEIKKEYEFYKKIIGLPAFALNKNALIDNGLLEYCGPKKAETIIIAMGSVVGTIKEAAKKEKNVGVLKIRAFRPFPGKEISDAIKKFGAKNVVIMEKAISLGASAGPLAMEIKNALAKNKVNISDFVAGLGGRDITLEMIKRIIKSAGKKDKKINFI